MKKLIFLLMMVFLFANNGCKKDQLQPTWLQKILHKETVIFGELNDKHLNVILPKIDEIRTTLAKYVIWDKDTIQVNGPGGYTPTAQKAWKVFQTEYEKTLMPDTLNLQKGILATIISSYLTNRRDYDRDKALKKLWLCIPKKLYKLDPELWELFLRYTSDYLTITLGGPDAWTDGTRQLSQEMVIYHLPTMPDLADPWHGQNSAQTRITMSYLSYAEGPQKSVPLAVNIDEIRYNNAKRLYDRFLKVKDPNFQIGSVEDYETQLIEVDGEEYYAVGIPNVPIE